MKVHDVNALSSGFLNSVEAFGNRPALEVSGEVLTYSELFEKAASLAATLVKHQTGGEPLLTAVFAHRSSTAFAGVLAALLRGHGYVPLNRTFPAERTRAMLQRSGCSAMIVDADSERQLAQVLEKIDHEILLVLPERQEVGDLATRWPRHRFLGAKKLVSPEQWRPADVSPDSIAYLMFTSGSTGVPKGVMVSNRNVRSYVDFVTERFSISNEDRFSQMFDMTFDLSAADMFVAWERGACVCCPPERALINPGRFINDARLTIWFSVPSTAVFMKRLGALKAAMYPRLRVSLFCGEALSVQIAKTWAEAAPNSVVENIYGPTELTIACTYYRWDSLRSPSESTHGLVPIGAPFPGMLPLVVDEFLNEMKPGETGELLMTGPQLSLGYWQDPARTGMAFVKPPGRREVYYRTGDSVRKPCGSGPMLYLGRVDHQIKILGHRVELGEVEAVVREESGIDGVVALGWPETSGGAGGVEVFLQEKAPVRPDLNERVAKRLPIYMLPRRYHYLSRFPLNANGKYDRQNLVKYLETLP
jgi:amino acid adenylation domain-containing protein